MIIAPLCSSSSANATFIGNKDDGILIDAGCSYKRLKEYLSLCEIGVSSIKAVLLTHEHIDHVRGVLQLTKHTDIPIFASRGTCDALINKGLIFDTSSLSPIDDIGGIIPCHCDYDVRAFKTPHDSNESIGFVITNRKNGYKIAYATDLGTITPEVEAATLGANLALVEANYDPVLLKNNRKYPYQTKERIRSGFGHLSNHESSDYILNLIKNGTTRIILAHLSAENNTPQIAMQSITEKLCGDGLRLNYDYTLNVAGVQTSGGYLAV